VSTDFRDLPIPFHDYLGLQFVKDGSPSRVELDLGDHVKGAVAPLHGGVLATLIDCACGAAAGSGLTDPTTQVPVSTDLTVRFLRQPKESPLVAEATVVHAGRSALLIDCTVTDGTGRQVGRGSGSYRIVTGFHDQAAKA
jgi:uncharacterized protein (TIGR00369 family)